MDVFKENFEEVLSQVETQLASCEFFSLDFEMSGISLTDRTLQSNYGDSPQERYAKMRAVVNRYSIIQLGLCLFTKDTDAQGKRKTLARPWNFYSFPASGNDVVLSVDAITFLKGQGMDFQQWIYKGVSFVDAVREKKLMDGLEKDREWDRKEAAGEARDGNRIKLSKAPDKKWLKTEMELIEAWLEKLAASEAGGEKQEEKKGGDEEVEEGEVEGGAVNGGGSKSANGKQTARAPEAVKKTLTVGKANSFLRRALKEAIQDKWPELMTETKHGQVIVLKLTEEEKAARAKARDDERVAKMNETLGLRRLFKAMCASKKPLVIHNGMYDLMFLFASLEGPLPELLKDFKRELKAIYPGAIYDTKYVSSREDLHKLSLGDTSVEGLYEALVRSEGWDKVALAEGFQKYDTSNEDGPSYAHEAGYDAYLTGTIFARFRDDLLEMYMGKQVQNRVYNYRSLFDLNLSGEDELVHKGHVFHVAISAEGKNLKTDDLMKLFGDNSVHVYILWINESGAFAVVDKIVELDALLKGVVPRGELTLTPFETWWAAKKAKEDEHERSLVSGAEGTGGTASSSSTTTRGNPSAEATAVKTALSGWFVDVVKRSWSFFKDSSGNGATTNGSSSSSGEADTSPDKQKAMKKSRTA